MRAAVLAATLTIFSASSLAAPAASCPPGQFSSGASCKPCYAASYATCSNARVTGATSCVASYYLKGGRCLPEENLPDNVYVQDGQIVTCSAGVKACTAAGITSCEDGYFLNADKTACTACATGAKTCSSASNDLSCSSGYFLSGSTCSQTCPSGTFKSGSSCKACYASSYTSCTNARVTGALTCATGYYLTSGRCMNEQNIPAGYYGGADGKITACPNGAKTCTAAGSTSCKTGFSLAADGKTCEAKPTCPTNGVCDASGALTGCATNFYLSNGACVATCPSGQFGYWRGTCVASCPKDSYTDGSLCASCDPHATWCIDANTVPTCESGWEYWTMQTGKMICVKSCPDGQYSSNAGPTATSADCIPCKDTLAATCFIDGTARTCKAGSYFDNATRTCKTLDSCPAGSYITGDADFPTGCASCLPDEVDENHEGIATCARYTGETTSCKAGYLFLEEDTACIPESSGCPSERYTSTYNVYYCGLTTFYTDYPVCTPTYLSDGECKTTPAGPGALAVDSTGKALSCDEGYTLTDDGLCTCAPGYFLHTETGSCVESCPSLGGLYNYRTCYRSSSRGYTCLATYNEPGTNECRPCAKGAMSCTGPSNAGIVCDEEARWFLQADGSCQYEAY
ncbi:hypothetical protein JCM10207_008213 [Rhodosporidiobolus poonsookiae]